MNTLLVRQHVNNWIALNRNTWPGLRAAHLTGGITTMPLGADFPVHRDVDLHLIFDDDSPMLQPSGPFMSILQVNHDGICIEAGLKPISLYRDAETVLANPEIAIHLLEGVESTLFDPNGLLAALRPAVSAGYGERRWVEARLGHERMGLEGALLLLPFATETWGDSGEFLILGYSATFAAAALSIATLQPLRMGSKILVRLRDQLQALGQGALYDELIEIWRLGDLRPEWVWQLLDESTEAFDLAVSVRRSPHPFQHKLYPHLRSYYLEASREMLRAGDHREAFGWLATVYTASVDVILADGPAEKKPHFAARQAALLQPVRSDSDEARATRLARLTRLYDRIFALTDQIVAERADIAAAA